MVWTEADDARVKEYCKDANVGEMTSCPKCGMGSAGTSELMLAHFCTHGYCPFRDWRMAKLAEKQDIKAPDTQPRVTDNDAGEISVTFNGAELRGWSYASDAERRTKMLCAREYVEGWCDGRDAR